MISLELARALRDAGLEWHPTDGDRFFIPDRDLDDQTFSISEMVVGLRHVPGGAEISFNGAVEWALDAIMQREVVWLPSETQLRELLGEDFVSLERVTNGYQCRVVNGGVFPAAAVAEAYGRALLDAIERDDTVVPRLDLDEI